MSRARASTGPTRAISLEDAWRPYIGELLRHTRRHKILLRDEYDRYGPNPSVPPNVGRADGTLFAYTREAWRESTARDRAIGEVHAMRMEAERLLGRLDRETLEHAIELAMHDFAKERQRPPRPANASRALRVRIGWLLQPPTTDAGRAWLLQELVRRGVRLAARNVGPLLEEARSALPMRS